MVARPLANALGSVVSRRPGIPLGPQLAFITRYASGSAEEATFLARRLGTSTSVRAGARRQLGLMALEIGSLDVATEVMAALPDDRSGALESARARLATEAGRYTEALTHARAADRLGAPGARRLVEGVEGHLTMLRPDWLPVLGPAAGRVEALRGRATKGRILHLVSFSEPYRQAGYTVRTRSVARAQIDAGLDAHVATRAGFPRSMGIADAPKEDVIAGVPYHRVTPDIDYEGPSDRKQTEGARATIELLETLRPAALQPASHYVQAKLALALGRPIGIPVVYEVRGFWEDSWAASPWHDEATAMATDRYRMTRETETAAMLAVDAVVTLSETMRQEIIERGIPAERLTVVPNAVEIEDFEPVARDDAIAASLGIGRGEPVVGYISSLNAYEGIEYLLEAASRLRSQGQKLRVLIVGEGDHERAIRATGRRLGLDDGTLIMPGRVPHDRILGYYALIDVFVVPRKGNRVSRLVTPLKPFEAMALERALVVSDLPALREIVTPGETGMTFKADDADDLARVLSNLLGDPALRARLGRQAREWIKAERTWAQNGRRYRELYERLGVA